MSDVNLATKLEGIAEELRLLASSLRTTGTSGTTETTPDLNQIPLFGENEKFREKWEENYRTWLSVFTAINVWDAIRRCHAWEVANPRKRHKNKIRFVLNWLSRENRDMQVRVQNHYGGHGAYRPVESKKGKESARWMR